MDYASHARALERARSVAFWQSRLEGCLAAIRYNIRNGEHPRHPGLAAEVAASYARDACRWARALDYC